MSPMARGFTTIICLMLSLLATAVVGSLFLSERIRVAILQVVGLVAGAICVQTAIVMVLGDTGLLESLRYIGILWATIAVALAGMAATFGAFFYVAARTESKVLPAAAMAIVFFLLVVPGRYLLLQLWDVEIKLEYPDMNEPGHRKR